MLYSFLSQHFMKNILFTLSVLLMLSTKLFAQDQYAAQTFDQNLAKDFSQGDYDQQQINMTNYDKDPNAEALVLNELGRAWISSNGGRSSLNFDYHIRIKLFTTASLKRGHVEIPYYIQDNGTYDEIRTNTVQAFTYYKEPNGAMHEQSMSPDSVSIVKVSKHISKIVFNLPRLSPGCIIEYRYILESPFIEKFKTWEFQSDIPKIYSEYEVHIPQVFGYNVSLTGSLKLSKDTSTVEKRCFESTNLVSDCTVEDYQIKNVPAFLEEPYIKSSKSYISALHFQATQYENINNFVNLNQTTHEDVASNWNSVDKTLHYNDNFGGQLNKKSFFKGRIEVLIDGKTDSLEIAKSIYSYIQKSILYDGQNSIHSEQGVAKAIEKHIGNVADVNLALIDALNEAGIKTDAVIISTRDNGSVNKLYPAIAEFNYVLAVTSIHGKDYLLDATEPELQFGVLPLRCLNDQGRVIPIVNPSYWINLVTPQQKTDVYTADLTLNPNNTITGTLIHYAKSYSAFEERKLIKSFKNNDDYLKSLDLTAGYSITKFEITNLDDPNLPLIETYTIQGNIQNDGVNPYIVNKLKQNPFKSNVRKYDVDMGMALASSYTVTLHLPDGKSIVPPIKEFNAVLPSQTGELTTKTEINGNTIMYMQEYELNKPTYNVSEYPALKSMYDDIVTSENTVLKLK
jgi:hypothetical protein